MEATCSWCSYRCTGLCKKSAAIGVTIILFLTGNNNNLDNDQRYCSTQARIQVGLSSNIYLQKSFNVRSR